MILVEKTKDKQFPFVVVIDRYSSNFTEKAAIELHKKLTDALYRDDYNEQLKESK